LHRAGDGLARVARIDIKARRPHHFHPKVEPFAFAGVCDVWEGDGSQRWLRPGKVRRCRMI
jgi:hypothetical protein